MCVCVCVCEQQSKISIHTERMSVHLQYLCRCYTCMHTHNCISFLIARCFIYVSIDSNLEIYVFYMTSTLGNYFFYFIFINTLIHITIQMGISILQVLQVYYYLVYYRYCYKLFLIYTYSAKGAEAAERARIVREYMQRKKEAELNKARAHGDLFGVRILLLIITFFYNLKISIGSNPTSSACLSFHSLLVGFILFFILIFFVCSSLFWLCLGCCCCYISQNQSC